MTLLMLTNIEWILSLLWGRRLRVRKMSAKPGGASSAKARYWQLEPRPNNIQPFRPSQCMPGFMDLESHLISNLNDYCKRKETAENGYLHSSRLV
jgi:hypothetical protein